MQQTNQQKAKESSIAENATLNASTLEPAQKAKPSTTAITIVILLIVISIPCIIILTDNNNWPAWFQAVGSISGILLAYLVALYQIEKSEIQTKEAKENERKKEIDKIVTIYEVCFFRINQFLNEINDKETPIMQVISAFIGFENSVNSIKKIEYTQYPSQASILLADGYMQILDLVVDGVYTKLLKEHNNLPSNMIEKMDMLDDVLGFFKYENITPINTLFGVEKEDIKILHELIIISLVNGELINRTINYDEDEQ